MGRQALKPDASSILRKAIKGVLRYLCMDAPCALLPLQKLFLYMYALFRPGGQADLFFIILVYILCHL